MQVSSTQEVSMLVRFGVENHRSIRDRQELSMVATAQRDAPDHRHPAPGITGIEHGVLPVMAIFGANAAGKSNLVHALDTFHDLVERSFIATRPGSPLPYTPWLGNGQHKDLPATTFDADLIIDGVRHHYGFSFTAHGFTSEWLHRWPHGRQQVVYEREPHSESPWYFGPSLSGPKATIADATRPNALFLSAAAQFNHAELRAVYSAITDGIAMACPLELRGHRLFSANDSLLHPTNRDLVLAILRSADLGIHGIQVEPERDPERGRLAGVHPLGGHLVAEDDEPEECFNVVLVHGTPEHPWTLPSEFESGGTQVLLSRIDDMIEPLLYGTTLVIDELETSLHPDICRALVRLFTSPDTNPRGAQLIFSTHNRELLSELRRDQVLLVDKGRDGVTRWASASDYRGLRKSTDKRKVHESGAIGGVPVLDDLTRIWAAHAPVPAEDDDDAT